ncbi:MULTISPECIES: energy transducer TonB [Symbiopectobacterium]|uniref:energy transducer TonB n=1 Tax=Symbiopectobacterium TaxID=801 RepID=UPI0027DF9199|nr:energy transducer TonB [Candidatus Symbiopectobacterium endolongispinus]
MAALFIVTLHAIVLALLARAADMPVTVPAQPQPVSVELVVATPNVETPPSVSETNLPEEVVLPEAVAQPEPKEAVKPVDENAVAPAPPEKKTPPPVKKAVPAKRKPTPQPVRQEPVTAANNAPSATAAPVTSATQDAPLMPPQANADYLRNHPSPYPEVAISRGQEGTVLLNVQVRPDGKVQTLNIQKSSGYPALDNAARDTVLRWSFVPARRGSQAVNCWVVVPVDFSLNS